MATAAKNPYASLIGGNAVFAGVDQGIDFTGPGPVYALGPGQVTRVEKSGSGFPGQGAVLDYLLTGGPAKGANVYVAEDFAPAAGIAQGTVIQKGQLLGYATGSGQAPGIEVGWANTSGAPLAALLPRGTNYAQAGEPQGNSFLGFVTGSAPVPTGIEGNAADVGSVDLTGSGGESPASAALTGGNALAKSAVPGLGTAESLFSGTTSFFSWIGNTGNLIRVGEVLGGSVLMLVGIVMLGRAASSSSQGPVKQVTGAATTAVAPARAVTARRTRKKSQAASQARRAASQARTATREQRATEIHTQRVQVGRARVRQERAKARREEGTIPRPNRTRKTRPTPTVGTDFDRGPKRARSSSGPGGLPKGY